MIIKGTSRAGPNQLGRHLQRTDTNERIQILELQYPSSNLTEALRDHRVAEGYTEEVRSNKREWDTEVDGIFAPRGAAKRDLYDASNVIFTENTLMIDTTKLHPAEVSGIILVEVFWRASGGKASGTDV